jgi:hypothetical protein
MRRESIYACTYTVGEDEHVGHVCAWDGCEAAELFAYEMEWESESAATVMELRARPRPLGGRSRASAGGRAGARGRGDRPHRRRPPRATVARTRVVDPSGSG